MPSLANSALRLLRRMLGAPTRGPGPYAGSTVVLDGNTAVAETEAAICEAAGLGGSFPADGADLAWRTAQGRLRVNAAGAPLSSQAGGGARGALAAAIGLSMSGIRATGFFSGPDLAACLDLLATAAGRRLPLVLHLAGRTLGGPGSSLGNGHEAFHACAGSGCFLLAAANVQEAADFALITRHAAERVLRPGIVAMDGEQTALALQDVRLPSARLIADLLGEPDDRIPCPIEAQRLLFGETRRLAPRWHDPDHPVMLGALVPDEAGGPGRAAASVFLDRYLEEALEDAFARCAELTGRNHAPLSAHRLDDARLILVAMGSAVETAEAVADHMRAAHRQKVGVLGIRCLSPFPGAELARKLDRGVRVCVLECADAPLSDDPPLLGLLRAAVDRAGENARFGAETHAGYPVLGEKQRPRFLSAIYGLAGAPLRASDLWRLCQEADTLVQPRVYLGMDFAPAESAFPKRQVLIDRLRRGYPEIAGLGLRERDRSPDLRPAGTLTIAIHRDAGGGGEGLAAETAALMHRIGGERLRARPALFTRPCGQACVDRVTSGPQDLREPGDEPPVELVLLLTDPGISEPDPDAGLAPGGSLLVQSVLPDEALWARLPLSTRTRLKDGSGNLYRMAPADGPTAGTDEYLLGAICGLLRQRGLIDLTRRRLLGAREEMLRLSPADIEQRLRLFEAGLDAPRAVATAGLPQTLTQRPVTADDEAPDLVRRMGRAGEEYDSLPRFWDHVGVLYGTGNTSELAPDPHLALTAVPPLSAGFRDLSPWRDRLPSFDPAICTGCGACWSACPEAAVGAVALTPASLIDFGIRRARADALRPLASKLAAGVARLCQYPQAGGPTAGDLIQLAYQDLEARLPFPAERKAAIGEALQRLLASIGCLPLSVTAPFFADLEADADSDGALLSLSISPETCKGCGICVEACDPGALRDTRQSSRSLARTREVRAVWQELPETDAAIIQAVHDRAQLGPLAASLLRPGAASAMAGGDGVEPGSGARLALRLVLAVLEARQAPLLAAFAEEVRTTRGRITALIRDILADALPADDLDALARRLEAVDARQADLGAVLREGGGAIDSTVDATRLRRLVRLARDLGDLAWRLETGTHGLGRSRLGLVLSPDSAVGWAGAFPDNPFPQPVVLDWTGDGAQVAAGLLEGQLRQSTEGFAQMRKARLELERPADAARLWSDLDGLTWRELDEQERALCPALLLAGDSAALGGRGLSQLARLLGSELPVRVLILADLDLGLGGHAGLDLPLAPTQDAVVDLALLTLSQRGAYIAQSCVAVPDHLAASLDGALGHRGPALLHLHAPSPARHGFASDLTLERARTAATTRVFPLFRYDPNAEGVFGSRVGLDGNPDALEPWADGPLGAAATPAHWALGEERFAHLFSLLAEGAPQPTALAEYLALNDQQRRGRTPFVERDAGSGQTRRLVVDARLVRVCAERLQAWRVLQELAGLVTPFTARVQREAKERVAAEHQAELDAMEADYRHRMQALREQYQEELRRDIRERLMVLAGYGNAPRSAERGATE